MGDLQNKIQYFYGYKAFGKGLQNQFAEKFIVGQVYSLHDDISYQKNGFHFCENLEDVLRYYDGMNEDIDICQVVGFGNVKSYEDEYYDYQIYVADHMQILKVLSRKEIIEYAKGLNDLRLCRFISGFALNEDEIAYLLEKRSLQVQKYIQYYQYGDKDAFKR